MLRRNMSETATTCRSGQFIAGLGRWFCLQLKYSGFTSSPKTNSYHSPRHREVAVLREIYEAKLRDEYRKLYPEKQAEHWHPDEGDIVMYSLLLKQLKRGKE